jgi:adenosine kinase
MLATYVIETQGTQEYSFTADGFRRRFADAYGEASAAALPAGLRGGS